MDSILNFIKRIGFFNAVAVITLSAILAAFLLIEFARNIIGIELPTYTSWVVGGVAFIIAPALAGPIVSVVFRLFELEKQNTILLAFDLLTGLISRHALVTQAANVLSFAERQKTPVSMLFIDIDNFKAINDKYGHLIGDKALHRVGQHFNLAKRESDLIGRYGGDELIALLPDTDEEGSRRFAKKLHRVLQENPLAVNNESVYLTLSIGITTLSPSTKNADIGELIRRSDLALYEAKQHGKNCTAFYINDQEFKFD